MTLREYLNNLHACPLALDWLGDRTAKQAWEECERADWLLWWAVRTKRNTHQQIVLAACDCARRALRFVPSGEEWPRLAIEAIEAAERWSNNPTKANREPAWAARASWAAEAAWAARASWAAEAAAGASWAAAWAAATAGAAGAAEEHRAMCVLIRKRLQIPWEENAEAV